MGRVRGRFRTGLGVGVRASAPKHSGYSARMRGWWLQGGVGPSGAPRSVVWGRMMIDARVEGSPREAVETYLKHATGAVAWTLEVRPAYGAGGEVLSSFGEPFNVDEASVDVTRAGRRALPEGFVVERCAVTVEDADGGNRLWALVFLADLPDGGVLAGAILYDNATARVSGTEWERDVVKVLAKLASVSAALSKTFREASALESLMGSLSISSVIVNKEGEVVLDLRHDVPATAREGDADAPARVPISLNKRQYAMLVKETVAFLGRVSKEDGLRPYFHKTLRSNGQTTTVVYVLPLTEGCAADKRETLYAILFPTEQSILRRETLEDAFSLTPAEANVVRKILAGKQIKEVSRDLQLSHHTVRTYLKRSFMKIGVNNQPQLISRVNMLSVPLRD